MDALDQTTPPKRIRTPEIAAPRAMTRVAFKLSNPSTPYWDGSPPREGEIFLAVVRKMTLSLARRVENDGPYFYDFGKGSLIRIDLYRPTVESRRYFEALEPYVQGMQGYDWLVDGIIRFGKAMSRDEYFQMIAEKGSEKRRRRLGF